MAHRAIRVDVIGDFPRVRPRFTWDQGSGAYHLILAGAEYVPASAVEALKERLDKAERDLRHADRWREFWKGATRRNRDRIGQLAGRIARDTDAIEAKDLALAVARGEIAELRSLVTGWRKLAQGNAEAYFELLEAAAEDRRNSVRRDDPEFTRAREAEDALNLLDHPEVIAEAAMLRGEVERADLEAARAKAVEIARAQAGRTAAHEFPLPAISPRRPWGDQ